MNLVLIGYRGTGKSTVAELLAKKLGMEVVSLDQEIVRHAGALFILNDRVDVAGVVPCAGVHVGQEDACVPAVRAVLGTEKMIGLSAHSREQADEAAALGADYVGIGPTFETSTKDTGYTARGVTLAGEVTSAIPIPAFAIGAISTKNLPALLAAGARRIAVSAAICSAPDPGAAAAELRELLDREP